MTEPDSTTSPSRQLFDDAVRALTAAARLDSGPDFAEVVPLAVAGAAANLGGVETALARRSRSLEASGFVRSAVHRGRGSRHLDDAPPGPSCLARKSTTDSGLRAEAAGGPPAPSITS